MKYDLNSFFDAILNDKLIPQKQNLYHNLKKVIKHYRNVLPEFEKRPVQLLNEDGQVFSNQILFDNIGLDSFYEIAWDINKALYIIQALQIQPIAVPLKELMELINLNEIDHQHLQVAQNNTSPAIIVRYAPLNDDFVIDGNHRIAGHYAANPQGNFPVYLLKNPLHINAMYSDLDVALYCIHQNLNSILNYIGGNVKSVELLKENFFVNKRDDLLWIKKGLIKF